MRAARQRGPPVAHEPKAAGSSRFRTLDSYRARREWQRYEGTGQRDLYRELRERFLVRNAAVDGWVTDLGSGPGRFLPFIGRDGSRRVALDISREMLNLLPEVWRTLDRTTPTPHRILGDARHPPFAPGTFSAVVVLGNAIGFAAADADLLLRGAMELVSPGGVAAVEIAPASGERSRYLTRLPPTSVARLLRAPIRAVLHRLDPEGFVLEPTRHDSKPSFRRLSPTEVRSRFERNGWESLETLAVAPVLGPDPLRISAVRTDPKAWSHLLELEEEVGRRPERWGRAAAVLISARRPSLMRMIK